MLNNWFKERPNISDSLDQNNNKNNRSQILKKKILNAAKAILGENLIDLNSNTRKEESLKTNKPLKSQYENLEKE